MGVYYRIQQAIEARTRELGRGYDPDRDRSAFASVLSDLSHSIEGWPDTASGLLDSRNLEFGRLVDEHGHRRKPAIRLVTFITTKHNLVLDWYPHAPHFDGKTDFVRFSDERYGWQDPENRLVMIHQFSGLRHDYEHPDGISESFRHLIEGVSWHLTDIANALKRIFEVHEVLELVLEYGDEGERQVTGFSIERSDELARRRKERRVQAWILEAFDEALGVSVESFLKAYEASSHRPTATARTLQKQSDKVSPAKVRYRIGQLLKKAPHLIEKLTSYRIETASPPPGTAGDVVSLTDWRSKE